MNRGHQNPVPNPSDGDFQPVKARHVFVSGLGRGELARLPGLLIGQKRTKDGWKAHVILVEPDGSVRQLWVLAGAVEVVGGDGLG